MNFSWIELLLGGSFMTAVSGFITLKATKRKSEAGADSVVIENAKTLMEEYHRVMTIQNEKIDNLERRVESTERKITLYVTAVNTAYRCKLPDNIQDCPVLRYVKEEDSKTCGDDCKKA